MNDRDDRDLEEFLKDPDTRHERILLGAIVIALAALVGIIAGLVMLSR